MTHHLVIANGTVRRVHAAGRVPTQREVGTGTYRVLGLCGGGNGKAHHPCTRCEQIRIAEAASNAHAQAMETATALRELDWVTPGLVHAALNRAAYFRRVFAASRKALAA